MKKHLSKHFTASKIKKHRIYIMFAFLFLFNYNSFAQIVNIPDPAFKSELVSNAAINTNGDGEIQVSEAVAYTGTIMTYNSSITDLTGLAAFTNLDTLHLQNVNLSNTSLNLTANSHLKSLDCVSFPLTSIDLSNNHELVYLWIQSTNITSLDLSHNNLLTNAVVSGVSLTSINVTNDSLLSYFVVSGSLTSIDVSTLHSLADFQLPFNQITNLDVSHNSLLWRLECENNLLTTLDLSSNQTLIALNCSNNPNLTSLNLQNGHNMTISGANLDGIACPNLTCIQVDSVAYSVANWSNSFDSGVNFSTSCPAFLCNVNIPDATFKSVLLSNPLINTNGDNEIQCSEAAAYTGQIYLINPAITDLTGLEAFVNIDSLNLNGLSNLTNPNLDLSANTAIKWLYVPNCMLTGLNVSTCDSLDFLMAQSNNLSSLDLSHNNVLTVVYANNNPTLSTINLTGDSLLTDLYLDNDQLTTVDVSTLHSLETFGIPNNPLTHIDLTHNPLLNYFACDYTNLTTLDMSQNHVLSHLFCRHCSLLTSINIQNTIILYSVYLNGTSCPNLTCVQVDSVAYAVANWGSSFDPGVNFSTSCPAFLCNVNIPDPTFKTLLLSNPLINTNGDNEIQCSEAIAYAGKLQTSNQSITDLTGLETFVNIDTLVLDQLYFLTNSNLDLTNNAALKVLSITNMNLTGLNISNCPLLESISIGHNLLSTINLSNKPNLSDFACNFNNFTSIDFSTNNKLINLNCNHNPPLTNVNLTNDSLLISVDFSYTSIASFDLSSLVHIQTFGCIHDSAVTQIDLSHTPDLIGIYINNDSLLNSLNLKNGHNTSIQYYNIQATNNPVLTCVEVDSVAYSVANWGSSFDSGVNFSTNCFSGVGIDELKNNSVVTLYPNPANNHLLLKGITSSVKYEIISLQGTVLKGGVVSASANDIELTTLSSGSYLLRLQNEQFATTTKLIIVH